MAETAITTGSQKKALADTVGRMCGVMGDGVRPQTAHEYQIMLNLAHKWLDLTEEIAENRVDRTLLPVLLLEESEANVPRQGRSRERVRHWAIQTGGGIMSAVGGFLVGIVTAALEALVIALDRAAVVLVPFTLVFLISCIAMTIQNNRLGQVFTWQIIQHILFYSFWLAALCGLLSATTWAAWTAYKRRDMEQSVERQRLRQVPERGE